VDLIRDNGFVGRGEVQYVAPGEQFELGFGPDDGIRVMRERAVLSDKTQVLSTWTVTPYLIRLYLSNLLSDKRTVLVRERVVVSEIDQIRVQVIPEKTTDRLLPDDNGFVDWVVEIPGHGTREVALAFDLKVHSDIIGFSI
jgi:hypothetical protein